MPAQASGGSAGPCSGGGAHQPSTATEYGSASTPDPTTAVTMCAVAPTTPLTVPDAAAARAAPITLLLEAAAPAAGGCAGAGGGAGPAHAPPGALAADECPDPFSSASSSFACKRRQRGSCDGWTAPLPAALLGCCAAHGTRPSPSLPWQRPQEAWRSRGWTPSGTRPHSWANGSGTTLRVPQFAQQSSKQSPGHVHEWGCRRPPPRQHCEGRACAPPSCVPMHAAACNAWAGQLRVAGLL